VTALIFVGESIHYYCVTDLKDIACWYPLIGVRTTYSRVICTCNPSRHNYTTKVTGVMLFVLPFLFLVVLFVHCICSVSQCTVYNGALRVYVSALRYTNVYNFSREKVMSGIIKRTKVTPIIANKKICEISMSLYA